MSEFSRSTVRTGRGNNYDAAALCRPARGPPELVLQVEKAANQLVQLRNEMQAAIQSSAETARTRMEAELKAVADAASNLTAFVPWLQSDVPAEEAEEEGRDVAVDDVPVVVQRSSPQRGTPQRGGKAAQQNDAAAAAAAAEEELGRTRAELARAQAERDTALRQAERLRTALDGLSGRHAAMEARYAELQARLRGSGGGASPSGLLDEEAYNNLDSVSVVGAQRAAQGGGADKHGYEAAVAALEERVRTLSAQLAAAHEALADERGATADAAAQQAGAAGSRDQLPLSEAAAVADASLVRVLCSLCEADGGDAAVCIKAAAALAALSRSGVAARALLASGGAGALADAMLRYSTATGGAPALQLSALHALYRMAGGHAADTSARQPGGAALARAGSRGAGASAHREAARRDQMAYECAVQAGRALVAVGGRCVDNGAVMQQWGHTVGAVGRCKPAARALLSVGLAPVLIRALRQWAAVTPEYAPLHACALAALSLAASSEGTRQRLADVRVLAALQRATTLSPPLAKSLPAAFPELADWLEGRAVSSAGAKRLLRSVSACVGRPGAASEVDAEALWVAAARSAAVARSMAVANAGALMPGAAAPPQRGASLADVLRDANAEDGEEDEPRAAMGGAGRPATALTMAPTDSGAASSYGRAPENAAGAAQGSAAAPRSQRRPAGPPQSPQPPSHQQQRPSVRSADAAAAVIAAAPGRPPQSPAAAAARASLRAAPSGGVGAAADAPSSAAAAAQRGVAPANNFRPRQFDEHELRAPSGGGVRAAQPAASLWRQSPSQPPSQQPPQQQRAPPPPAGMQRAPQQEGLIDEDTEGDYNSADDDSGEGDALGDEEDVAIAAQL